MKSITPMEKRIIRINRFLLFATFHLIFQMSVAQSQYHFKHFDTKDGLADNYVGPMAQDSLGYMWFQYYGGLTRFDGNTFTVYKHDPDDSLRSSLDFLLGGFKVDKNRNVWIIKRHNPSGSQLVFVKYDRSTDGFVKFSFDLETNFLSDYEFDKTRPILWLGMREGRGLYSLNLETKEIINYLNPTGDADTNSKQNSVNSSTDRGSMLLLATSKGFWSFNKETKTFTRPACNPRDSSFLFQNPFFGILKEIKKNLWVVGADNQLVQLGPDLSVLQKKDFPKFPTSSLDIDEENVFWFGTWWEGIYRFNPADDSYINIRHVPGDPHSLRSNSVNDILVDRDQNVWVSTEKGASKLHRKTMEIVNLDVGYQPGGIYKTRDNEFIITTNLTVEPPYNFYEVHMGQVLPGQVAPMQFKKTPISRIRTIYINRFFQGKNKLWISTTSNGVFAYPINPDTEMIADGLPVHYLPSPSNPDNVRLNQIGAIWEDDNENLWAGRAGLQKIIPGIPYGEKGSVVNYKHLDSDTSSINGNSIFQIYPENETSFWVVTDLGVDLFHRDTEKFEHVFINREMPNNLCKTSDGMLFLGTLKGLYQARKELGHCRFDRSPIWDRSEVKSIQEDRLGRLWLHTATGLICYDRKENVALEFNEDDGLLHIRGTGPGQFYQTSQGVMFTIDRGITLFNPLTLIFERKKTNPVLTKLEVNNRNVSIGKEAPDGDIFLIPSHISVLNELTLDYRHNNFTLEFSAMEMTAPDKNLYSHKLDGYDPDWIETDYKNRTATYTNLPAGVYTFRVKASNHHGVWSDQEKTLLVKILPPPWKTLWAYTGYGLLVVALLFLGRRAIVQRERLKSNLKLTKVEQEKEHFELEKAKEVDKVKSAFFTNISHEFRTPLTLIKGPVQDIIEQFVSSQKDIDRQRIVDQLRLVQRNSDLLLKLINQLLDLAKLESGSLTLDRTEGDLNSFLNALTSSFSSMAIQKNITLKTELPSTRYVALFDKDKLEAILINLINNAIKFTPSGGKVNVRVQTRKVDHQKNVDQLIIMVSDTGIGIPEHQQSKIFERFYQVSEAHKEVGTGIGLSLVKELITLLGGTIVVKSEPGKGSEFTVVLPLEMVATADAEIKNEHQSPITEYLLPNTNTKTEGSISKPHVLVVEDNHDLRKFIIDSLGDQFHFLEAADGKQGMEVAFEEVPDLIISDVMMPEIDGITMTGKLKKDTRTSHIPIILLTAKTSEESKLIGLSTGADDYLTKPFNKNELLLKVRNSIKLRQKVREKIRIELLTESPKVEVQSADEQFLWKVKEAILARLGDEQLSVESLSEQIGMSRSQLFRKVSALTGASVNELIRTFRLQKAAQLLEQHWGPVTQVAYEVGFSNLSYFSKVFKEQYGVLPSEYPVRKINNDDGSEHLSQHENVHSASTNGESTDGIENTVPVISYQQPMVLLVEDNADMRNYIRKTLQANYDITEAENGREGVKKAEEIVPDLIISDIMMPEMDGYKLCEIIKTKELTSHIPVILLTAKADRESKLTGLEMGADDYLTKPFDAEELKLIIRNRIEERRKMRERFSRGVTLEPGQISVTSMDEKFLTKVLAIIEEHMDDENFSIEDFSSEAGYSHIHFYRKIKALSGQSPSLFLRTIRLKRAADLLSRNSDNVSQIAYAVGFGSFSYFNKCFKEQFGVTPGQYAESNQAK